jgi:hypothetical protein
MIVSEKKYFILQNNKAGEYLCIDNNSGGYPFFSKNYNSAEKFDDENSIEEFYNGGKWNSSYKRMFPEETKNLDIKTVKVITMIE